MLGLMIMTMTSQASVLVGPNEIESALRSLRPGQELILRNGIWADVNLLIEQSGEPHHPISIRAETPGNVVFCKSSSVQVEGDYVNLSGLLFKDGSIRKGSVIELNGSHDIVIDCAVMGYNPPKFETKYYWAFFNGSDDSIERCLFLGKNHMHPVIGNAIDGARRNRIVRCHFKDIPYAKANGRETIRVWGYGKNGETGPDGAYFSIIENLFEHADGEGAEIISLKSNRNIVQGNTILSSRGGITIRQGNFNRVINNFVLGDGIDRSYGVRVTGQGQEISRNYIERCTYGISLMCGEYVKTALTDQYVPVARDVEGGRIPKYAPISDLHMSENTLVDNAEFNLDIGGFYRTNWPQEQRIILPERCIFSKNTLYAVGHSASVIGTSSLAIRAPDQSRDLHNQFQGNVLIGGTIRYAQFAQGTKLLPRDKTETGLATRLKVKILKADEVGPSWLPARLRKLE